MSLFPRKSVGYSFIHDDCNSFILIKNNNNNQEYEGEKSREIFFEKRRSIV